MVAEERLGQPLLIAESQAEAVVAGLVLAAVVVVVVSAGQLAGAVASMPAFVSAFHDFDGLLPAPDHRLDIGHLYIGDSDLARTGN